MPNGTREAFNISIYVPDESPPSMEPDPAVDRHSLRDLVSKFGKTASVAPSAIEEQWAGTVEALISICSKAREKSSEWLIEEIEVGLTLSAKGELLFIAEAGAEASIKLTLKRRHADTT